MQSVCFFSNSVTEEKVASEETKNQESTIVQIIHNAYSTIEEPMPVKGSCQIFGKKKKKKKVIFFQFSCNTY